MRGAEKLSFRQMARSRHIIPTDRVDRYYPTRDDYVSYMVAEGWIHGEGDLLRRPDLVLAAQRHWHQTGQNGCRFAQFLSHSAVGHGWGTIVIPNGSDTQPTPELWKALGQDIDEAIHNPAAQVLSIIFPGITTVESLAGLIQGLLTLPSWDAETTIAPNDPDLQLLSLRVRLPASPVVSWVLGFGPFEFFPMTRQSPFTELIFMLKPKAGPRPHPSLNPDPLVAHIADIPVPLLHEDDYERMIAGSQNNKRMILADYNDAAAKARVTFPFPAVALKGVL